MAPTHPIAVTRRRAQGASRKHLERAREVEYLDAVKMKMPVLSSAFCTLRNGPQRVHTHQDTRESACGSDVICQAPCWPPAGHASVRDDVAVNGVLNAMACECGHDDPCAPLEPGNGRDREQCQDDRFTDHGFKRAAHYGEQHV